ncbi:MAG: peptide chain release factor N(5)-glutamine methyltransferase [Pseudomonadota bacterium]
MPEPNDRDGMKSVSCTRGELLAEASRALRVEGRENSVAPENARTDAIRLVAAALDIPPHSLLVSPETPEGEAACERVQGFIARRLRHEPVSRIIGSRAFWKNDFIVTPATLDPRADSETVVALAGDIIEREGLNDRPFTLLDLGTGTGCLAISLLMDYPTASAIAVDIDPDALAAASLNSDQAGVADRFTARQSDWTDRVSEHVDLVISNPPYIPSADIADLAEDVRNYDPHQALDGGADGLDAYRMIARAAARVAGGGWLVLECGQDQADAVDTIMQRAGHRTAINGRRQDLAGIERALAYRITKASPLQSRSPAGEHA